MPRRTRRRTRRRGGVKLGEGRDGIVIRPAIPCAGKDRAGYVSKVFKDVEDFRIVTTKLAPVLAALKTLDPAQARFLYPILCETPGDLLPENKADGVTDDTKHQSYAMRDAGEGRPFGPSVSKATLVKVLEALKQLHDAHICHGDLHSENILVLRDGTIRILDFDSAELLSPTATPRQTAAFKRACFDERYQVIQSWSPKAIHDDSLPRSAWIVS